MKRCTWLIGMLVVLGAIDRAPCKEPTKQPDQSAILQAQVRMLRKKLEKQTAEIEALRAQIERLKEEKARLKDLCHKAGIDASATGDRRPAAKPAWKGTGASTKTPTDKAIPVSIRHVLAYAFQRAEAAENEKTEVRQQKILDDALARVKSMLARGPITLTYEVIDVKATEENVVRISVGYPKEVLDACVTAKQITPAQSKSMVGSHHRYFSVAIPKNEALAVKKGARSVLRGKAELDSSRREDALTVFERGWLYYEPSFVRSTPLIMKTFTFSLRGREVRLAP